MFYKNGSMQLRLVKKLNYFSLFERLNTGDNSQQYWVIGFYTEFNSDKVTWGSGSYFEGYSEKEMLDFLRKKENAKKEFAKMTSF